MAECPVCHSNDQVKRVVALVEAGTTRSTEYSDYRGWITQMNWTGPLDWTSGPMYMVARRDIRTQTDLARRLSFDPPEAPRLDYFGYGYVLSGLFFGFLIGVSGAGLAAGVAVALLGMGAGWLGVNVRNAVKMSRFREQLAAYLPRWEIWRQLYFCERDYLVFLPDGTSASAGDMHEFIRRTPTTAEWFREQVRQVKERAEAQSKAPYDAPVHPRHTEHRPTAEPGMLTLLSVGPIPGDVIDTLREELGLTTDQVRAQIAHMPVNLGAGLSQAQVKRLQHKLEQSGAGVRLE